MLDDSGINGRYKLSHISNGEIIYMQMTTKWGEQHMLYKDIIDEVWRVSSGKIIQRQKKAHHKSTDVSGFLSI